MLLPRSRYDEGVEIVREAFESFPYGDPNDIGNMAGPLINARQRERVLGYIEKGKAEGARAIVGGGPATQFEKGYFVQPTLFVDVDPDSTIAQEEIFGPVLSVIPFDDDDDAVRIANNSRYGLSGAVTSASLDRALGVARRIRTGTIVGERRPVVRPRLTQIVALWAARLPAPPVMRRCLQSALVICLLAGSASSVGATPILLNFEGLQNHQQIGNFYNGGAGGNYGVTFSKAATALIDQDAGGQRQLCQRTVA